MNSTFAKILRIILGVGLIFFGLDKFINFGFMHQTPLAEEADNFMNSLISTGYVFTLIGVIEILIGLLLLLNKWVSFALLLLAPITVNILLFHLFLDSPGLIVALIVFLLNIILIYKHWKVYKPLFH